MSRKQQFISNLKNTSFAGDIATQKSVTTIYATDNSIYEVEPYAIIFPKNSQDVELIFDLLRKPEFHEIKITARGGGTSTNGQSINEGFIVDYSRYMNKILKIDAQNFTAEVEPGVILDVLNKELEAFGLYFPSNISPSNRATIGGMVNTDACGKGSCTHGRTSDNISDLSLHFLAEEKSLSSKNYANSELTKILQNAQNLYSSKHLARTATGYNIEKSFAANKVDLNYLISGSEGTLALVSKVTVKLKKLPLKKRLVLLRYSNFDKALADAQNLISLKSGAIETIDENVIRLARNDIIWQDIGHLIGDGVDTSVNILEFAYDDLAQFEAHNSQLESDLKTQNYFFENYFITEDKKEIANIWNLRKKGVGLLGAMKGKRRPLPFVEDTIVPPQNLAKYITEFRKVLEKFGITYGMFGHVDAGCLHVRPALNMRQANDRELIRKITDEVAELLLQNNGILWGEHGKGFRSEYNNKFFSAEVTKAFHEIKKFFDPFDQLNSGKIASAQGEVKKLDEVTTRGDLDQNISPQIHDEFENILSCNGNALCFNLEQATPMCPSYKATNDRVNSPKGRAMLFKEWIRQNAALPSLKSDVRCDFLAKIRNLFAKKFEREIYDSFDKCLGCKACNTQCPIKVSIPDAKAYFLSHYFAKNFRKIQDYLIGYVERILLIFGNFPMLLNLLTQNFVTKFVLHYAFGIIDAPRVRTKKIKSQNQQNSAGKKVYLLREVYSEFYHGAELQAAFDLLLNLGFDVKFSKRFENGKALHSKGFLNSFRKLVRKNIVYLQTLDGELISVEPSLALSYRDEYSRFSDEKISVSYFPEFLQKQNFSQKISKDKKFHLVLHCSEQTNFGEIDKIWRDVFAKFGVDLNVIKTGCCGMSGSFGNEAKHFSDSKKLFETNWKKILTDLEKDQHNVIMVSGSSCQAQVDRLSDVVVKNPAVIISKLMN